MASYFTINVSSPNTPGLRNLQQSPRSTTCWRGDRGARTRPAGSGRLAVLLKIAPDLARRLDDVVHCARPRRVDGMVVANTTLGRPASLRETNRGEEQGGLSGGPLFRLATRMVAETYVRAEGAFPLVSIGGIDSGGAALTRIRAGASLIQLYSSLIYKGLGLVEDIKNDLYLDLAAHRPGFAVGNRRRGCRDDYRGGLAGLGEELWTHQRHCQPTGRREAPPRDRLTRSNPFIQRCRSVDGIASSHPPSPEGESCGRRALLAMTDFSLHLPKRLPQHRRIAQRLQPAARGIVHQQRGPQPGIA